MAERRVFVGVRLAPGAVAFVDARAAGAGVGRSEMVRRMLAFAASRMPEGWRPK